MKNKLSIIASATILLTTSSHSFFCMELTNLSSILLIQEFEKEKNYDTPNMKKLLLELNADPNVYSKKTGKTPLMYAAEFGMDNMINILTQCKANINSHTKTNKKTALMYATLKEHAVTIKLLLSLGAKKTATDNTDKTAHEMADNKRLKKLLNPKSFLQRMFSD